MKNIFILIAGVLFTIGLSAQITKPNLRLIPIDDGGDNGTYYRDADGDTFGDPLISFQLSAPMAGWVLNNLDCNDADANITTGTVWYRDQDLDGFGDPNSTLTSCSTIQPLGYVSNNNDGCPLQSGTNNGCPTSSSGLSDENYIHSTTYLQPFALDQEDNAQETQKIENITYFDGLGRPIQQIGIRQSPLENDIVTHLTYDNLGRQAKGYLPYASTIGGGNYRTDALTKTNDFYNISKYQNTTNPYSEQFFDETPLNLVVEQAAPGNAWKEGLSNEHTIKNEYKLIENTDQVYNFHVSYDSNGNPQLVNIGYFYIGEQEIIQGQETYILPSLYKFIVKNENWVAADGNDNTTHIFKDFQGRIILSRAFENSEKHDTYNVYDNYGKLAYVIPPKVTINDGINSTELNELCYQYKYDTKDRLVEKKIPGKGWEYIVYNKFNQPILTQDAMQRAKSTKEWLYSKFDMFGRVVYTGIYKDSRNRSSVQTSAYAHAGTFESRGSALHNYTKNAYPTNITADDVLTVSYYDDYNFDTSGLSLPASVYGIARTYNTKGLATGVKEKVLGTSHWITTITGYDKKARAIYVASKNQFLNTTDVNRIKLDFTGKVEENTATHTSNTTVSIIDKFAYDHVGRLLTQKQKINTQAEELIVKNKYDELGSLENKKVGNTETNPLQTLDYTYNVRGWLTNINDINNIGTDLFTFKINYNTKDISATTGYTPLYTGDITETIWRTKSDHKKRAYQYKYDALSRIKGANYRENDNLLSGSGKFETSYDYDKNGNLIDLIRNGSTGSAIDVLSYNYANSSNKLTNIGETSGNTEGLNSNANYTYEANNGNLTIDTSKGITNISYNYLNLPTKVEFGSAKRIEYIYTATGVKLQKKVTNGSITTTNYAGSFIYEQDVLKYFSHPEGYVEVNGSSFKYIYQYSDHLGNIRLNYTNIGTSAIPNLQIREENNYYPFGLKHKGYNSSITGAQDNFKYNSKELQTEIINSKPLEWYDYGARNYDPTIGRWLVIDDFAEKAPSLTPFRYGFNNPINVIDPDGNFEQDDFWGPKNYSSLTIYGEEGGPITIGGASGSNGKGKKESAGKPPKWKSLVQKYNSWLFENVISKYPNWFPTAPFDARGYEIYFHWSNGTGNDLSYNEGNWGDYMRNNNYIKSELSSLSYGIALNMEANGLKSYSEGNSGEYNMEIQNGLFTGYELLHGTNHFSITSTEGVFDKKNGVYNFQFSLKWHDRINPNLVQGDGPLADFMKKANFGMPKDYNITIQWTQSIQINTNQKLEVVEPSIRRNR